MGEHSHCKDPGEHSHCKDPGEHQEKGAENTLKDIKAENCPYQRNKNLGPGNRESPK